ncbi:uncharacterized protein L201_007153 [Kwoniella dendrophila CBS 6074]|uniref:Zn(2)-C6 fungal-type domain-containing protein n=1 Tax=Kwoniella dendrophila CBS 6074 TaxID=1295534 RepID=A0AAX4K4Z3_9TREE
MPQHRRSNLDELAQFKRNGELDTEAFEHQGHTDGSTVNQSDFESAVTSVQVPSVYQSDNNQALFATGSTDAERLAWLDKMFDAYEADRLRQSDSLTKSAESPEATSNASQAALTCENILSSKCDACTEKEKTCDAMVVMKTNRENKAILEAFFTKCAGCRSSKSPCSYYPKTGPKMKYDGDESLIDFSSMEGKLTSAVGVYRNHEELDSATTQTRLSEISCGLDDWRRSLRLASKASKNP